MLHKLNFTVFVAVELCISGARIWMRCLQDEKALLSGPTVRGLSCLTPLLPLLDLAEIPETLLPRYVAAWLLMHRVTLARCDGDALLMRLALGGTIQGALLSNLWTAQQPEVRRDGPALTVVNIYKASSQRTLKKDSGKGHCWPLLPMQMSPRALCPPSNVEFQPCCLAGRFLKDVISVMLTVDVALAMSEQNAASLSTRGVCLHTARVSRKVSLAASWLTCCALSCFA